MEQRRKHVSRNGCSMTSSSVVSFTDNTNDNTDAAYLERTGLAKDLEAIEDAQFPPTYHSNQNNPIVRPHRLQHYAPDIQSQNNCNKRNRHEGSRQGDDGTGIALGQVLRAGRIHLSHPQGGLNDSLVHGRHVWDDDNRRLEERGSAVLSFYHVRWADGFPGRFVWRKTGGRVVIDVVWWGRGEMNGDTSLHCTHSFILSKLR